MKIALFDSNAEIHALQRKNVRFINKSTWNITNYETTLPWCKVNVHVSRIKSSHCGGLQHFPTSQRDWRIVECFR